MSRRSSIEASKAVRSVADGLRYLRDADSYYRAVTMRCYQDTGRSITGTRRMVMLKKRSDGKLTLYVEGIAALTIAHNKQSRDNILSYLHSRAIFVS